MNERNIPNFFIVGAAKAGTTSLFRYLNEHPNVYFSPIKEPNFFSTDICPENFNSKYKNRTFLDTDSYFQNTKLPHIQLTYIEKPEQYLRLFEHAYGYKAVGESSTSYLYSKNAAREIYNFNPEAKIIIVLRNPIERAFSHYQMAVRYGFTIKSFYDALKTDWNKNPKGIGISELYIELGLYAEQIKRYYDFFPENQLCIFLFEDLKTKKDQTINGCLEFLGLSTIKTYDNKIHNESLSPRFKYLNYLLNQNRVVNPLKNILPTKTIHKLKDVVYTNRKNINPDNESVAFLHSIMDKDIQETEKLIGRKLSHWLS